MSFMAFCLTIFAGACLQITLCCPWTSTVAPHLQVWATQMLQPRHRGRHTDSVILELLLLLLLLNCRSMAVKMFWIMTKGSKLWLIPFDYWLMKCDLMIDIIVGSCRLWAAAFTSCILNWQNGCQLHTRNDEDGNRCWWFNDHSVGPAVRSSQLCWQWP